MCKGSTMIPTQRSVTARFRYRSLDGGWSEYSLCRATRIRVFPRNATIEKKTFVAERKISSLCTPLVDSAEQDSSRHVFWVSSYVKFVSSTIFAWLCDTTTQCNTRFSSVFISFNVGYVFSRQLIMRINLIFFAVILIPFIMINLFEKAKKAKFYIVLKAIKSSFDEKTELNSRFMI